MNGASSPGRVSALWGSWTNTLRRGTAARLARVSKALRVCPPVTGAGRLLNEVCFVCLVMGTVSPDDLRRTNEPSTGKPHAVAGAMTSTGADHRVPRAADETRAITSAGRKSRSSGGRAAKPARAGDHLSARPGPRGPGTGEPDTSGQISVPRLRGRRIMRLTARPARRRPASASRAAPLRHACWDADQRSGPNSSICPAVSRTVWACSGARGARFCRRLPRPLRRSLSESGDIVTQRLVPGKSYTALATGLLPPGSRRREPGRSRWCRKTTVSRHKIKLSVSEVVCTAAPGRRPV
jgi:hypothetical protein